jgi:hypothetical protein
VKEKDLKCNTRQMEMSSGMFRALNLAIQLNYWSLTGTQVCMLVDDIGEGLDFERATRLIQHLVKAAQRNNFQLIMTSNDRFVMNSVSLDQMAIIDRRKSVVRIINKASTPKVFERFREIGLNNFDFFARDLYKPGKTRGRS